MTHVFFSRTFPRYVLNINIPIGTYEFLTLRTLTSCFTNGLISRDYERHPGYENVAAHFVWNAFRSREYIISLRKSGALLQKYVDFAKLIRKDKSFD